MNVITEKDPLISVIIPILNKGPYIARAIHSASNQTIQNFEIIIMDGGSEDNGPGIVKDLNDPRIHFLVQSGKGVSNARNEAVNFSKNEFIAFLDADDEWMPNHLEAILRLVEKYPDAGMYTTAYKTKPADGKVQWMKHEFIPKPPWEGILPEYFKSVAVEGLPVQTSSVVIPRKIFDEIGGFDEGYWMGEDVDLFGKIALKYPVAFSWEFGAIYHWDDINCACNRKRPLDYEEPFVKTARTALKRGEVPIEFIESLNEYISRHEIAQAKGYVCAGDSHTALMILKKCKTRLFYFRKIKWLFLAKIPYPIFCFLQKINLKFNKFIQKKSTIYNCNK